MPLVDVLIDSVSDPKIEAADKSETRFDPSPHTHPFGHVAGGFRDTCVNAEDTDVAFELRTNTGIVQIGILDRSSFRIRPGQILFCVAFESLFGSSCPCVHPYRQLMS